ncbi:MAG: LdpA C-terminal domain-containing domain [Candidatus Gastranaerophilaceae bacterium]
MMHLKTILEKKNCFKLICGAGNENLDEVEKLVALYAKAGCHFFDLCASEEVLKAAQKGLNFAIPKDGQKDYHFCVSIGTKNDIHMQKAKINAKRCVGCGKCIEVCSQGAIRETENGKRETEVIERNCIGCMKCQKVCEFGAISFTPHPIFQTLVSRVEKSPPPQGGRGNLLTSHLSTLQPFSPACIELHASDIDVAEVDEIWNYLNENFDGLLSLCVGRSKLSNEEVLARVKRLAGMRKPYTTIIQADGSPMSGGEDDFKTTLQAVAMAELIQSADLPVYLMLSGGTNSKTAELAKVCGVDFNGIGVGSFARKIVKEFIARDDFFTNKAIFNEALKIAENLVQSARI